MLAVELIQRIRTDGGTVRINDSGVLVAKTSPDLMEQLRAVKPAVLDYLFEELDLEVDLDFETRSEFDIKKGGAHGYAMHPSTIVLCAGIARKGVKPRTWLPGDPVPWEIIRARTIVAHNAIFEYLIIEHAASRLYGWPRCPLEMFRCTMAKGRVAGLPGNLEKACEGLGL
jgi:hypothetical protein